MDNYYAERWEFHKPGFHAVRTNEGCCASDSNWLFFLIHDNYEQMGFMFYSQKDGNGHFMNYIFHNGWYYFIDMMMYRTDSLPFAGKETGTEIGYRGGELIAGNLHKSKSPISYVNYCLAKHREAPIFFSISSIQEAPALGIDTRTNKPLSRELENEVKENGFDLLHSPLSNTITVYLAKDSKVKLKFEEQQLAILNGMRFLQSHLWFQLSNKFAIFLLCTWRYN